MGIKKRGVVIGVVALIALAAGVGGTVMILSLLPKPTVLPDPIRQRMSFSPLVTVQDSPYKSRDFKLGRNENGAEILSFVTATPSGNDIVVTEQALPQEFTDIPEYRDKFLENKKDDTVATASGTINLFRATKQDNKVAGLMIERGLLIFLNPAKPLAKDEWRAFGDQLELQRVTTPAGSNP